MKNKMREAFRPADLGTILGVWAHPDDESWFMAGLMAAAAANGQRVACITATRGEKGSHDDARWPPAALGKVREAELLAALEILGAPEHYWLDYIDGELCDCNETEAITKIADIVRAMRPDTVVTFGSDGMTGHPDHCCISRWSAAAVRQTGLRHVQIYQAIESQEHFDKVMRALDEKYDIYFNIDKPPLLPEAQIDVALELNGAQLHQKIQALKVQVSQTESIFNNEPLETIEAMAANEYFMLVNP